MSHAHWQRDPVLPLLCQSPAPSRHSLWAESGRQGQRLSEVLSRCEWDGIDCLALAGSLARREAHAASDCDVILILAPDVEATDPRALAAQAQLLDVLNSHGWEPPKATGIYGQPIAQEDLLAASRRGQIAEDYTTFGTRMACLLEAQPVWGNDRYRQLQARILDWYRLDSGGDFLAAWQYLLDDLVRYFKALAIRYRFERTSEPAAWRLRNLKGRFHRWIWYAGLLSLLLQAGREPERGLQIVQAGLELTPLERLLSGFSTGSAQTLLTQYDALLEQMTQPGLRQALAEDTPDLVAAGMPVWQANATFQRLQQLAAALHQTWINCLWTEGGPVGQQLLTHALC